jgi:hypothetical protein
MARRHGVAQWVALIAIASQAQDADVAAIVADEM